ncbi:Hypothetical protein FKW44_019432 [Caligus rogercresseyi]|uniref:Uncharacterized protein n=1 Tax=Caligus rogercresseyi TaxID=217165 RepID=A0A7T8GVT3_CALRO|nr:Hypothetical protein FKW44_019432 [Caligus rogercresseyi]
MIYFVGWWIHCDGSGKIPKKKALSKGIANSFRCQCRKCFWTSSTDKTLSAEEKEETNHSFLPFETTVPILLVLLMSRE